MNKETLDKIYQILDNIKITPENENQVIEIRRLLDKEEYEEAIERLGRLTNTNSKDTVKKREAINREIQKQNEESSKEDNNESKKTAKEETQKENEKEGKSQGYPHLLSNPELEKKYIGLLVNDYKLISKYYFLFDDCYFESDDLLNIYKRILFTEGQAYAPVISKEGFNFARHPEKYDTLMSQLRRSVRGTNYNIENIYVELRKLFELRKHFTKMPIKTIQDKIVEVTKYKLYDKMTVEEITNAVNQITVTSKFKQAILNRDLTEFIKKGDNNLTNGLEMPFPILNYVFKGIRKGETMAIAMPSNAGKSRFTINLAAYTAMVHKKKILVISNEMSEEKMKLCLVTTIINNPTIQKMHGYKISKTEGEILEYKYRPDKDEKVELDENGFVLKKDDETHEDFIKRLFKVSSEYKTVIAITDWINNEIENSICFMNITDHTNDELRKVIMNYYYKEEIEYVFYDTLKTDVDNIGSPEEIKRTATILANLAQTFGMFIFSTLQLAESITSPLNLNVNDLAVSRTVKEVLDTLALVKQINRDNYNEYEYSLNETDTKFFEIERFEDPDVRYYSCVVDKNRAGAKPTVLFRLNLAYNRWEELGHLRLKQ